MNEYSVTIFYSPTLSHRQLLCCFVGVLILFLAVGCSGLQPSAGTPQVEDSTSTAAPTGVFTPAPTTEPELTPYGPVILRVWVPPQFDPALDTSAGIILQSRLDQFTAVHPDVKIEVRVKAADGPGGLLEVLTTAGAAAPLVLPDVVALSRPMLETAALKGLIHPFNEEISSLDDSDWYEYAQQLGQLQDSTFGLPFAGDALVLVYRAGKILNPPQDWPSLMKTDGPLIFPAADSHALFTLALYQSAGGLLQDEQGRPVIDENILSQVLTLYQNANQTSLMPYTLTQYETDQHAWTAFQDEQARMVITWISRYLGERNTTTDIRAALLPTSDGAPFTLATGWMWALASTQPDRQILGAQLAEFLSSGDFLAEWSVAINYLPTRPSSSTILSDSNLQTLAEQIGLSAQSIPSTDVLSSLGMPLSQAVAQVLKQQRDPLTAAQEAANYLRNP